MDKLSIIIPVFNTEKYLSRCIDSVINQTYKNLEVIVVNDCSPGNAEEIISTYTKYDSRIKYVTYEKNRGLFRARVAGAEQAMGDYIAFLDSDDYVTLDYYNTLMKSAKKYNSDIAIGNTIFERVDGSDYVRNLHDECFNFEVLRGECVRKTYYEQKGLCFSWHTVWNKIYKKKLWDKCYPFYKEINNHLIMTEDIAFSSLLFYYAESVSTVKNDGIFYCENENASTNAAKTTMKRFIKNMEDIKLVFNFVNSFFDRVKADEETKNNFNETKKYYSRMWRDLADSTFSGEEKKMAYDILQSFTPNYNENTCVDDHFFASISTEWNGGLEAIKEQIIKSSCKYVSFDIFDTLITRCVYKPDDIFLLMNKKFEELINCNINFMKIRIASEAEARRRYGESHPEYQDVNIDEIYDCMSDFFEIPSDVAIAMKEEEKRLEIELIRGRASAKELFDVALLSGKRVILVSDMYLDENTIEIILKENGYSGYSKLYLSSSYRLTKHSGGLFKAVLKDLEVEGKDIIHIGDTWNNDIVKPKALGLETIFFPKAVEVFENKIQGYITNMCHNIGEAVSGPVCDSSKFMKSLGYRSMLALASNYYFDNPYRSFNNESDFNADPYFIGFMALGTHLLGLSKWMLDSGKGYDEIYFMARDGYMPMKAFNIFKRCYQNPPMGKYIHASRRLLLPEMIMDKMDFYDLPVEYRNHTPKTILDLLSFCSKDIKPEKLLFVLNEPFNNEYEYNRFIKYFIDNIYDEDKHKEAISACERYFEPLKNKNAATFDMGYSGRIQTAVSKTVGRGVDVFFVHRDAERSVDMARKGDYNIYSFYDFYPNISGLLREHIFSDTGSGCIGLSLSEENVKLVFDNIIKQYQDSFVIGKMQQGAIDFVEKFTEIFGVYIEYMSIKPYEVSLIFEGYLRAGKDIDRGIFKASYFEDLVYGSKDKINIYKFVRDSIMHIPMDIGAKSVVTERDMLETVVAGHSRGVRAICYMLLDRKLLKLYCIDILARKPKLLRALVKIKHTLFK